MKNILRLLMTSLTLLVSATTYADGILAEAPKPQWRPVIGVGGGAAITTNLGQSQTFPIQNPVTDEYYIYSPTNRTQTQGLFEVFLGAEHPLFSSWLLQGGLAYSQTGSYQAKGNFIQGADAGSANQYTSENSPTF